MGTNPKNPSSGLLAFCAFSAILAIVLATAFSARGNMTLLAGALFWLGLFCGQLVGYVFGWETGAAAYREQATRAAVLGIEQAKRADKAEAELAQFMEGMRKIAAANIALGE